MRQLDSINPIEAGKEFERYRAERDECDAKLCDRIAILEQELAEANAAAGALLDDEPVNGEYVHSIYCNASRKAPVGNDMCSCKIGQRIKKLVGGYRGRCTDLLCELEQLRKERDSLLERLRTDRNFIAEIADRAGTHIHDVMVGAVAALPQPGTAIGSSQDSHDMT